MDGASLAIVAYGLPSFGIALALALYATPLARSAALRFGIVDKPDGRLKVQAEPVPYLGGLAIYGAFLVAMALALALPFEGRILGMLLGGSIVVILGLVDDLGSLPYGAKFVGQLVAVVVAVRSGVVVSLHYLEGAVLESVINVAVSVLWLVLVTNAVNLVDIMDGLAGSVSLVATLFFAVVAVLNGRNDVLCVTAALAGAILGFLRFNRHPARIYMGDTGALFLGFMLGALGLVGSYTMSNPLGFLTPIYILAVPIFDTSFVSVVRILRGASPFRGSPDHFAIRLRRSGSTVPAVVRASALVGVAAGALGVLNVRVSPAGSVAIGAVVLAGAVAVTAGLVRLGRGAR